MKIEKRGLGIALGFAVLAILSLGRMSAAGILAISVGTLLLAVGLWISYRPASVFGFMTLAIGSGLAVDFDSVTDSSALMSAALGILVPVYITGWVALSSEIDEPIEISVRHRATLLTTAYTIVCVFSVPIGALILGLTAPNLSAHMTIITEAAIMLLAISIWVVVLTSRATGIKHPEPTLEERAA